MAEREHARGGVMWLFPDLGPREAWEEEKIEKTMRRWACTMQRQERRVTRCTLHAPTSRWSGGKITSAFSKQVWHQVVEEFPKE